MSMKEMALAGSHDFICSLMEQWRPGKVLDSPCGAGALSCRLSEMGHEVSCCDIDSGNFQCHGRFDLKLADFNSNPLPYPDEYFDYIVSANGLHRLFYPDNLLSEFKRTLKSDGKLVLSWPNYYSIARRIKFLLTGSIGKSIDFASYDQTVFIPAACVRFPLSTSRVEHLLKPYGLRLSTVSCIDYRGYDYLLYPIACLISLIGKVLKIGTKSNDFSVISGGSTTIVTCEINRID